MKFSRLLPSIAILMSLSSIMSVAQQMTDSGSFTKGRANGHLWDSLPDVAKTVYLSGVMDGKMALSDKLTHHNTLPKECTSTVENVVADFTVHGYNIGDYQKEIDKFYEDGANVTIPIVTALDVASNRFNGMGKEALERYVETLRKFFNDK